MERRRFLQCLTAASGGLAGLGGLGGLCRAEAVALRETFQALVERIRKQHDMPAMGGWILDKTGVREIAVAGTRRRGGQSPVLLEDAWHMGSLTKSMTAVLFAQAVEAGDFSWNATLGEHFPNCHASLKAITLHELLEHRAGFAHSGPPQFWKQLRGRLAGGESPADSRAWWVPQALTEKRALPEGEEKYSNFGCVVLGHLMEKLAKKPWETLLRERLGQPLGLKSLGFGPTAQNAEPDREDGIWGHGPEGGNPVPPGPQSDNPAALGPAGTVHMNLGDLATYARWHLTEGESHAMLKLSKESWQKLHRSRLPKNEKNPGAGRASAGWFVTSRPWAKGECYTHSGSNTMNYALLWIAPLAGIAIASVANQGGDKAGAACDQLLVQFIARMAANKQI